MFTHERVRDIMTDHTVVVAPDASLCHAHALMLRHGFRHLPVVDGGRVVGVLSDRDVWRGAAAKDGVLRVEEGCVRDVMSAGVITCTVDERLGDVVDRILRAKIDALPVVDPQWQLIGILTSTDLLDALRRFDGLTDLGAVIERRILHAEREPKTGPG